MQPQETPYPYETKAAQRWEKTHHRHRHMLQSWRTPQKQKTLTTLHSISLILYATVTMLFLFTPKAAILWIPVAIFGMTIWTMLRITINAKDSAPPEVLDEYELKVLDTWRRHAYSCYTSGLTILCVALVALGTALMMQDSPSTLLGLEPGEWMYFFGLVAITFSLACSTLPALGYAKAFPPTPPQGTVDPAGNK